MVAAEFVQLDSNSDLNSLECEWRSLEARANAAFFTSWTWIGPWLHLILASTSAHLFKATNDTGRTIALAVLVPCRSKRNRILAAPALSLNEARLPGLNMIIEYNDLLIESGQESIAWQTLFQTLNNSNIRWMDLILSGIPEASWYKALESAKHCYPVVDNSRSPWSASIEEHRDLDSVMATLSRNKRWQIRRSIKHYQEHYGELRCEAATSLNESLSFFSDMGVLHTERWNRDGLTGSFANPNWVAFHRKVILEGFERGEIQILRISAGDLAICYIYSFLWRGQVYMLQTGIIESTDNNERPGYIAHAMAMAFNGAKGMKVYDFMCGDAEYKRSLASEAAPLLWAFIRKRSLRNFLEETVLKFYRRVIALKPHRQHASRK